MKFASRRLLATATAATLLAAPLLVSTPADAADDVTLNLIGINDFHGRIDANTVKFAGTVEKIRQEGGSDNSLLISAGDNVSASLFASATQGDIPTIDVLNALHLDASAAGNHEFDKGADDLVGRLSDAADFPFLAANVFRNGAPLLDKSATFDVNGVSVAVVGAVTKETLSLVSPGGMTGVSITDPTDAINDTVAELEASATPPDVIVASIHEGAPDGTQTYAYEAAHSDVFKKIAEETSPDVDAIFMGHTHQAYTYDGPIPGEPGKTRPIIQTGNYGSNVGNIKLTVDGDTGDVKSYTQANVARVTTDDATLVQTYPDVATVKTITDAALAVAAERGNQVVATQTADITTAFAGGKRDDRTSESTLGNLVADALLSAVGKTPAGADIAVTNSGGLRAELLYAGSTPATGANGEITFAEANGVLPFVNNLSTTTLSGANFKKVLEQQWQRDVDGNVPTRAYLQLGLSKNVRYTYDPTRTEGDRITSIWIDGAPIDPAKNYRIALPAFLTTGGDNFRAFTLGTSVDSGLVDYQAFIDYLDASSPVSPDFARRTMAVTGVKSSYEAGDSVAVTLPKLDLTSLGSPANTSVTAKLKSGDTTTELGSFPVTAGAATVAFDLPAGLIGPATLEVEAAPTGSKATIPLTIDKASSTTTATAPAKAKTGTTFTVEATVASESGVTPTGTVTVKDGSTELASGPLVNGSASLEVNASKLSADAHTLTVSYSGDALHEASTGSTEPIEIVKGGSGFGAVVATTKYGTSPVVQLTADPEASGLVYVTSAGQLVGMGFLTDGAGTVTLPKTGFKPGTYDLKVFYAGDEKFDPTSTTATLTVTKAGSKATKSYSTAKVVKNKTKATVKVKVSATGFTVTSGTVKIYRGTALYGSATVKNGTATVTLKKFTTSGTQRMTASYGGNSYALPSTTSFTIKVVK
ncbi:5'-nucleotidase C-terminal domain-containing protein [Aeromicrobium sp. Root236]|uniref:5'-nucleotidase C-terminal domain-containing protein n=1 Tax=Aeromicrobium sp. Root236 TaxID=1736498 RepID=UPI0009E8C4CE|nr:5'-nucleotidase C-terminal domain-containing protein [Aeromicrobium sp. Root236]